MTPVKIHAKDADLRPIADLVPYAKNSRQHSPESVSALARGLREYGWTYPVLIDEKGGIIAGHGRVMAAQELGMTEVPVIVAAGWTEDQKRAYVIWDNKSAELSTFDLDLLRSELGDLRGLGFDLNLTGFGADELADLFKASGPGRADPDYVPPIPAVPVSVLGDVWLLGKHRLTCGDATNAEDVARALDGQKPHLMITDQPYGVSYDPSWRKAHITSDPSKVSDGQVQNDDRADWREAWSLFPGEVAYVWHDALRCGVVQTSLEATRFEMRSQIVWNKPKAPMSRAHYHWKHEICAYAVRRGGSAHWSGGRKQSTVWDIANAAGHERPEDSFTTGHGTQKPIECMRRPIENNSKVGDRVYDPFLGSGSTLIAAQMTKRILHAVELDPVYCDVCVRRWQSFTGEVARLEATGQTLEEVAAARGVPEEAV